MRIKPAMTPAAKHRAWVFLLILAFSFPVGALFESPDTLISYIVVPAIILLPAIGVMSLYQSDPGKRSALLLTILSMTVFSIVALLLIEPNGSVLKIATFWATLALFGAFTAAAIWNQRVLPIFEQVLIGLGVCALLLLVLAPSYYPSGRMSFGMANPIWVARDIGLLGLGCFALIAKDRRHLVLGTLGIALCLCGMILTRSRGPILALLLAFAIGALLFDYRHKARILITGAMVAGLAALLIVHGDLPGTSRLVDFSGTDKSTSLRVGLYQYCLSSLALLSNGIGVGNFHFRGLTYPHNIFVEFLLEWGWPAGSLYIAAIASATIALLRSGPDYNALKLLLIFELVNACFSGNITSPRFLYGLVIIGNAMIVMRWRDVSEDAAMGHSEMWRV